MEKLRKYINNKSSNVLVVNEKDIDEFIELNDCLMVPVSYHSITDKRIEFIEYQVLNKRDLEGYLFIDLRDLTKDLKSLFKDYYGCLTVYLHDSECYEEDERYIAKISLNEQFEKCLKNSSSLNCFLTKNIYQGITLYDPLVPKDKERWSWVETYSVVKI